VTSGISFVIRLIPKANAFYGYGNYLSTMLPRSFKDLEWHKGKKHRHRRHLSLLLRGLLVISRSQSSA
jgi:hypothetical protein